MILLNSQHITAVTTTLNGQAAGPPLGTKPVTGATRTGIKNAAPAPVTVPAK